MAKPKKAINRRCNSCGAWYLRGNRIAVWDKRNPGSRSGWHKDNAVYCMDCFTPRMSNRVLVVAGVRAMPSSEKKRA